MAILAVALALCVQIVVMAVLDGMLQDMRQRIRDLGEQITITFYDASLPTLTDLEHLDQALKKKLPNVRGLTPLIQSYGAIEKNSYFTPVIAYGIDLSREAGLSQLPKHLLDLKLDPKHPSWTGGRPAPDDLPRMFIGAQVAERLQVMAGDRVSLSYVLAGSDKVARQRFVIASTFRSGSIINDRWVVYIPHRVAQKMFLTNRTQTPRACT